MCYEKELAFNIMSEKSMFDGGVFVINNLEIKKDNEGRFRYSYDCIRLYLDDERYESNIIGWSGRKMDVWTLFVMVLNAYLRGSSEYDYISGWEVFDDVLKTRKYNKKGLLMEFPLFENKKSHIVRLEYAVPDNFYYSNYDEYYTILLDSNKKIKTNLEAFYLLGLEEDQKAVADKETTCLYNKIIRRNPA